MVSLPLPPFGHALLLVSQLVTVYHFISLSFIHFLTPHPLILEWRTPCPKKDVLYLEGLFLAGKRNLTEGLFLAGKRNLTEGLFLAGKRNVQGVS